MPFLPTFLELSGVSYPKLINEEKTSPIDGKSMVPFLYGEKKSIHDTLYWEHEGGKAIRIGDWKMSSLNGKSWELFNMSKDHTETNNLAETYPEKVAEMNLAWENWIKRTGIKIRLVQ